VRATAGTPSSRGRCRASPHLDRRRCRGRPGCQRRSGTARSVALGAARPGPTTRRGRRRSCALNDTTARLSGSGGRLDGVMVEPDGGFDDEWRSTVYTIASPSTRGLRPRSGSPRRCGERGRRDPTRGSCRSAGCEARVKGRFSLVTREGRGALGGCVESAAYPKPGVQVGPYAYSQIHAPGRRRYDADRRWCPLAWSIEMLH
jgi:hypothetical protein